MNQITLFDASPAEKTAKRRRGHEYHLMNLIARLGDGRDWEYTGDCAEDSTCSGVCACKHSGLRWLFTLRNTKTGDTAIVGSKCIEHFQDGNPDLVASVRRDAERLEREAADRRKAAERASRRDEVELALDAHSAAAWALCERLAVYAESFGKPPYVQYRATRRVTYGLWSAGWKPEAAARALADRVPGERFPRRWKQYVSPTAFRKCIEAETAWILSWMEKSIWM